MARGFLKIPVSDEALNRVQSAVETAVRRLDLRIDAAEAPEPTENFSVAECSAGVVRTSRFAGRAYFVAGNDSVSVRNENFKATDNCRVFIRNGDVTLTYIQSAYVAEGVLNISGNTTATNDTEFFWEVVRS